MTRQTMTALVSAVVFVGLAIGLAVIPVPFVVFTPGGAVDVMATNEEGEPLVDLGSVQTYPTTGRLEMTTVAVTQVSGTVGVPEAILAHFLPSRETLPREAYYREGVTADEIDQQSSTDMTTSQDSALIAALREAGQPVEERPEVASVTSAGPAEGLLQAGDLIVEVGGVTTRAPSEVTSLIGRYEVGDEVTFLVLREGREMTIPVVLGASNSDTGAPIVGIELTTGYRATPQVSYNVDPAIGGPSAGLIFALAIYDKITPEPLLGDLTIAGSGEITPDGVVGEIGGVDEKIAAAERSGATAFLTPAGNCADITSNHPDIAVVPVSSLAEAIDAVDLLRDPATAGQVPRC